jgi:hypothetical protein
MHSVDICNGRYAKDFAGGATTRENRAVLLKPKTYHKTGPALRQVETGEHGAVAVALVHPLCRTFSVD